MLRGRIPAATLSLLLHAAVVVIALRPQTQVGEPDGTRRDDALIIEMIEDSEAAKRASGGTPALDITLGTVGTAVPAVPEPLPSFATATATDARLARSLATAVPEDIDVPLDPYAPAIDTAPIQPLAESDTGVEQRKLEVTREVQAMLVQRLVELAPSLDTATRVEHSWQHEGQTYRAVLARPSPAGSTDLENILVDIIASTEDGTALRTRLTMAKLAFSQFTQVVDRWDSNVQLHDDEIIGRFHSNSAFYVAYDGGGAPRFRGKVTTASHGYRIGSAASSRHRDGMFQGGFETRTGRIELPRQARPFDTAPSDAESYVHTFDEDTHLRFLADGEYEWQARSADTARRGTYSTRYPAYFLAARGVTLHVGGTVSGRVLVYSAERIVIEDNLLYATHPRMSERSNDYLGLVSDNNVEIAPPYVTGRGDLHIDAAIFARRQFLVSNFDYPRPAKLIIYGSLTAGTISATEPRYATRIEFDSRLDRARPPGFPTSNRYEVAQWEASWTQQSSDTRDSRSF